MTPLVTNLDELLEEAWEWVKSTRSRSKSQLRAVLPFEVVQPVHEEFQCGVEIFVK